MKILMYIVIVLAVLVLALYLFWLKLKKGKPGRIVGSEVLKKNYEEALVVDVRWRKEYDRGHAKNAINVPLKLLKQKSKILKPYKDKDIVLYCTVDVTSRAAEKLLREEGFTKLHIGDGVKQYNYGSPKFKNILMSELKYLLNSGFRHTLVNVGQLELNPTEIKTTDVETITDKLEKDKTVIIFSDNAEQSLISGEKLGKLGYKVLNLIEPFDYSRYVKTSYNKKDFEVDPKELEPVSDCG